jgi:predicted kinase
MKELILLRGLPGSGKSTLAKVLADNKYPVFSVDDYFTNKQDLSYHFEFEKNHLAYRQCEENTKLEMQKGTSKIFVDNTFTMDWETVPYQKMAEHFGYRLHVLTVEKYHQGQNIHDVSAEQLEKMASKYKVKLL